MDAEERDEQIERKRRERWVADIEQEYRSLRANDAVIHNKSMQERILANWREHSPKMWANLQKAGPGFAEKLAYVVQERMWQWSGDLVEGGMPAPDAREMAEREILMLEPEDEVLTEDRLDLWTPPLPKHAFEASAQCDNEKTLPQATAEHPMLTERRTQRELELLEAMAAVRPDVRRRIQKDAILEIVVVIALLIMLRLVFG
jgi:hypothetical protein